MAGTLRIGLSGWTYKGWRGAFYPRKLPQRCELAYAAERFNSLEINGTFYGLQKPDAFGRWREETPEDFVFSVKGSRFITHMLKLKDVRQALSNFLASGLLRLGPKLGPILWQFPPQMRFQPDRFEAFLDLLPTDTEAAARLARAHDERLDGRAWVEAEQNQPMRHAFEIRHDSFRDPAFLALLRHHGAALVCADTVDWPLLTDLTSDFVYCRLHGSQELYVSGYDAPDLDLWAGRVRAWARGDDPPDNHHAGPTQPRLPSGRDVYVYFDNDAKVRAPVDAAGLAERLP
ncbi:MAG: hypothetical protein JWR84_3248 [Caulobacter sp.]|nr:hypothetical protein [Caulobacter sp.]